jgi:putative flavoprotein involved in K+ transport
MDKDVIVIGAGQAGLATGYWLRRQGLDFAIVDGGERVGDAWRTRWDSLRLFTPGRFNDLPGMPCPSGAEDCPTKDELADYFEAYAARFELPVQLRTRVGRLARAGRGFELDTSQGRATARVVVVATGSHATPVVPSFAVDLDPAVVQANACTYRNSGQLPPGPTLVVGAGNSGVQIAMELAATRPTILAGPSTGRIPRRVLGVDVFRWIEHVGLMRWRADSPLGRHIVGRIAGRGDPVIGTTRREIDAAGVERRGRVVGVQGGRPVLADGTVVDVRSVVWCCGIRPDFGWIDGLRVDARGNPEHVGGRAVGFDDLYFAGLRFQRLLGSGLVGGVGRDAEVLAETIAARLNPGAGRHAA